MNSMGGELLTREGHLIFIFLKKKYILILLNTLKVRYL